MDSAQVLKDYNIDPTIFENSEEKIIDKTHYEKLLKLCINLIDIPVENISIDGRSITLQFKDIENAKKFEPMFHSTLLKAVNIYIKDKLNENPKKYNRSVVLETKQEGISFVINY